MKYGDSKIFIERFIENYVDNTYKKKDKISGKKQPMTTKYFNKKKKKRLRCPAHLEALRDLLGGRLIPGLSLSSFGEMQVAGPQPQAEAYWVTKYLSDKWHRAKQQPLWGTENKKESGKSLSQIIVWTDDGIE